ncbi:glycosyltransferase [Vogesella sp. XCS3]|uniref:MraY family glycosyltransferase n=1 Tax=Vogesella sp. XCS3 TaxID=2877939 RepID=UPI001D0ABD16|nr:glycosyltransferase [Vogesella sp. XCS3]UDM17442.1 glycosyltransferase [Vogesella sp. XCS3]
MEIYLFFASLVCSLVVAMLIIRYQHLHERFSLDHDLAGVQKFHVTPTPRIGGVPVFGGFVAGALVYGFQSDFAEIGLLLAASLPVFVAGLVEDLTKRVSPMVRLLAAFLSAGLGVMLLNAVLVRLGLPLVDGVLLAYPPLAVLVTVFAVGGVCHSVNIIDGYNGLMGGVSVLASLAFAYVSYQLGDGLLFSVSLSLAAALLGFLVWNFPRGLIFAGDAGAYFVGFMLAELAVLLVARHPQTLSPWFPLLVLIYPIFETVFTILRRRQRKVAAGLPDSMHFHQVVYKRLVRWMIGRRNAKYLLKRNSMTAPYLWAMALLTVSPAMLFWQYEWVLQLFCILFIATYVWLYRRIVRFRSPRWLVYRKVVHDKEHYAPHD